MSNLSPGGTVALGVVVGLISTCVQSFGLTLQRKSHMIEDSKSEYEPRRAPYQRRRWQVGMSLFLLANIIGSSIQITTLPLPLLSTLQASGLVFNSIMASLVLKEAWTWRTFGGTILVAGGAAVISLFSALPEPSHNLDQLMDLLNRWPFIVWFSLSLVLVVCVLVMDYSLRKFIPAHRSDSPKIYLIRGMAYGMLSGILSAHALLLAKSAVELIVRSLADKVNQFSSYKSWLLVIAFLVMALTQLYYLHLGLRLVSTSILYPFVFCIYNIIAILDGLIYFRQMDILPPLHAGLIAVGTVILLGGVLVLSWRLQDDEETDEPEHVPHVSKTEIPQTVLAPGMGFIGEPDSESESAPTEDSNADDETQSISEDHPLLQRSIGRRNSARQPRRVSLGAHSTRRRRRAATLKEVLDIWEELGEDRAKDKYGSFDEAVAAVNETSMSSSTLADSEDHAVDDDGQDAEPAGSAHRHTSLQRASTMPASPSRSRKRRSTGTSHRQPQGSALFSDMLRLEWWRSKRKNPDDDEAAGNGPH